MSQDGPLCRFLLLAVAKCRTKAFVAGAFGFHGLLEKHKKDEDLRVAETADSINANLKAVFLAWLSIRMTYGH